MHLSEVADILHILSEEESLKLFRAIATRKQIRSRTLRAANNLTIKQYYLRLHRLTKLGLIKRKFGFLMITSFGEVIYDAKMKIDSAINQYWQLKAVDSIQSSGEINKDVKKQIISEVVTDKIIKTILLKAS